MNEQLKDKTIKCIDCGTEFLFTVREQQFYKEHDLNNEPKRCKQCRDKRKKEKRNFDNKNNTF